MTVDERNGSPAGRPRTDPHASASVSGEIAVPADPEAARVHAAVVANLLGEADAAPVRVGRFTLLERVAEGGMGVVWAAYDPELDRKVAVKLLRREQSDASVRKRIVREAQAMAKLSHPNVAQIYEVGEHRGATFIAMEFVRGPTLRQWQRQASRSWHDVVAVYLQAGRGLAAAHAVGLVHRDFKPDNAMLGREPEGTDAHGRVRVLDFGLARSGEGITAADLHLDTLLPAPREDALGTPLTHDGAVMGTPAYMAPEQLLGEDTDARTDQFSFCVALWEALFGERPFAGTSRAELLANVTRGRLRAAPKAAGVPAWLREVLARGLSVGPGDRYPSMDALLAALADDPSRRRRRRSALVLGLGAGALVLGGLWVDRARGKQRCADEGARIGAVWNDDARAGVRAAVATIDRPYATETLDRVEPLLDAYAQRWADAREASCVAVELDHTWTAELGLRAADCLDHGYGAVAAFIDDLRTGSPAFVQTAVDGAYALPEVAMCRDETALRRRPAPAPGRQAEAFELRGRLFASTFDAQRGHAVRRTEAEAIAAAAVDLPALRAQALRLAAGHAIAEGDLDGARALIDAALDVALRAGDDDAAIDALIAAVNLASLQGQPERMHWCIALGETLLQRGGNSDDPRAAELQSARASALDDLVERQALQEQVLAFVERVLGADHPYVSGVVFALAATHGMAGRTEQEIAGYEQVLAHNARTFGEHNPRSVLTLMNLAAAHGQRGEFARARPLLERALAMTDENTGVLDRLMVLENLAAVDGAMGDLERARAGFTEVLERQQGLPGVDPSAAAGVLVNLADIEHQLGERRRAVEHAERARERASGGASPFMHLHAVTLLASIALDSGRTDEALAHVGAAEAALAEHAEGTPAWLDDRLRLADIAWAAGDRARARAIAEHARLDANRFGDAERGAELGVWLTKHPGDAVASPAAR